MGEQLNVGVDERKWMKMYKMDEDEDERRKMMMNEGSSVTG